MKLLRLLFVMGVLAIFTASIIAITNFFDPGFANFVAGAVVSGAVMTFLFLKACHSIIVDLLKVIFLENEEGNIVKRGPVKIRGSTIRGPMPISRSISAGVIPAKVSISEDNSKYLIRNSYPESERRARWSQYLSSGNSNILYRKEDRLIDLTNINFYIPSDPVRSGLALTGHHPEHNWLSSLSDEDVVDWLRHIRCDENPGFVRLALNELKQRVDEGRIAPNFKCYTARRRAVVPVDYQVV
ncbi:hypothetical protein E4G67_01040 [Candidatus Bathyarchaeota archaeon]|nr:MAG: hypothetical protein E4G67_01040 [Candidatus Bathyarchaeota archaeon]